MWGHFNHRCCYIRWRCYCRTCGFHYEVIQHFPVDFFPQRKFCSKLDFIEIELTTTRLMLMHRKRASPLASLASRWRILRWFFYFWNAFSYLGIHSIFCWPLSLQIKVTTCLQIWRGINYRRQSTIQALHLLVTVQALHPFNGVNIFRIHLNSPLADHIDQIIPTLDAKCTLC